MTSSSSAVAGAAPVASLSDAPTEISNGAQEKRPSPPGPSGAGDFDADELPALPKDFTILGTLGTGGMGRVFRARQHSLQREVAVKVIACEESSRERFAQMLVREARLCARLRHPNIVQVHQAGRTPDGGVFVAMELMAGRSLQSMAGRPVPSLPDARRRRERVSAFFPLLFQLCDAVQAAHDAGIVHRDIKPANIQIDADGRARVLDFGLALLSDPNNRPCGVAGTPTFMAPEQLLAPGDVDHRCDVFALGAIAFFLMTGRPPRKSRTLAELHHEVVSGRDRKYRRGLIPSDVPEALVAVIEKALKTGPDNRFACVADLRAALEKVYLTDLRMGRAFPIPGRRGVIAAAAVVALAAVVAGLVAFKNSPDSTDRRAGEEGDERTLQRIDSALDTIDVYLGQTDLSESRRGLVAGWRAEIERHQADNRLDEAATVAEYATLNIEREQVISLAATLQKLARGTGGGGDLNTRIGRFVGHAKNLAATESVASELAALRAEGLQLLSELHRAL